MPHLNWVVRRSDDVGREMSGEELGYIAGLIDGEGTISVYARQGQDNLSHVLNEHVSIVNTNLTILLRVQEMARCGHIRGRDRDDGTRVCFVWQLDGRKAVRLLRQVRRLLVGKQEQCDLVLEVADLRDSRRVGHWIDYRDEDLARLTQIVNRVAQLNGGKRAPFVLTRRLTRADGSPRVTTKPGAPQRECEVEGCSARVATGCGGMCLVHFGEVQDLLHERRCEWCGEAYQAERSDQRFCCPKCQWQASRLRREGKGQTRSFACSECGKEVVTTDPRKITCDSRCYSRLQYRKRKESGYFEARKNKEA